MSVYAIVFPKVIFYSQVRFAVVFIGSTLFALQQLSGINAVFYFSSTVFKSAGVQPGFANACVGIANLAGKDIFWLPGYGSCIELLYSQMLDFFFCFLQDLSFRWF